MTLRASLLVVLTLIALMLLLIPTAASAGAAGVLCLPAAPPGLTLGGAP